MITLAGGGVDSSSVALQGLKQSMQGAGRSVAALSSGEKPSAAAYWSGAAPETPAGPPADEATPDAASASFSAGSTVGRWLNAVA